MTVTSLNMKKNSGAMNSMYVPQIPSYYIISIRYIMLFKSRIHLSTVSYTLGITNKADILTLGFLQMNVINSTFRLQ